MFYTSLDKFIFFKIDKMILFQKKHKIKIKSIFNTDYRKILTINNFIHRQVIISFFSIDDL